MIETCSFRIYLLLINQRICWVTEYVHSFVIEPQQEAKNRHGVYVFKEKFLYLSGTLMTKGIFMSISIFMNVH
jgi:hypothetical protein